MLRRIALMQAVSVAVLLLVAWRQVLAQPSGYEDYWVVEIDAPTAERVAAVRELEKLGSDFEVWSEVVRPGPIEARVAPAARGALARSGLKYRVVIEDLQEYLDGIFGGRRVRDFFDSFRTYEEHVQFMQQLAASYPDLAEMIGVGTSVNGLTMWGLRITGQGDVKPAVLYHGAQHGNEASGASLAAYLAWNLLTGYGSDPAMTELVDGVEWYLVPITNPDGYVAYTRRNAHNVDLNRNWDGPGAGGDPWGGPYPFSEPETRAMRDFLAAHPKVRVHLDLHGYVPWIIWPWGHVPDPCPDHDQYLELGQEIHDLLLADGGGLYEIGSIYNVAYPVYGGSNNYAYGVAGRWSIAFETRHRQMPQICQEFLRSMLFLGEWISGFDCNANGVPDADDIAAGTSTDFNGNGRPDECERCLTDLNADGVVNSQDFIQFLNLFVANDPAADFNGDGSINSQDFIAFLNAFVAGC